jgi:hypothetical protein
MDVVDGQVRNTPRDLSRRTLLRNSAVAAAVAVPLGLIVTRGETPHALALSAPAAQPASNRAMLQHVNAAFQEIQSDENAHVAFLAKALGSGARPKPTFKGLDQSSVSAFIALSRAFENTGVGAYLFGAGAITSKDILGSAASILTIEARHAGFLDYISGQPLGPNGAFDKPMQQADIVSAVSPFIANLNGGPDPSGPLKSDTDILNFALLLEYLESEFYNTNVPKFYGGSVPGNG